MADDPLIPVFMPALVAMLLNSERKKGSPLTREEVLAIRDKSSCVMLYQSVARDLAEKRGYDDLDPEFAWENWQIVRQTLVI